ncbi:MAG: glycosyltransferase family 2 protein, partial [Planctomycetales bacterium]|nr:glycosyltransferase family 2 protein [Planctomycetales bacterium]
KTRMATASQNTQGAKSGDAARPACRVPVSAAVICFNEAHNIARCLETLAWCEEIVVVDSGSTDGTQDIVRSYPNTKLHYRRFDDYIQQKNHALDLCQCDWAISLDADEVLTPALTAEIHGLAFDVAGYHIGRRTFLGEQEIKHGTWSPDYNLRLFDRNRGRWGGTNPHESVQIVGATQRLSQRMLHYSFRSRQEFIERNEKYTRMSAEFLRRRGKQVFPGQGWIHAAGNFVKAYFLKGGLLDGYNGFYIAWHTARFSRMKYDLLRQPPAETPAPPKSRAA